MMQEAPRSTSRSIIAIIEPSQRFSTESGSCEASPGNKEDADVFRAESPRDRGASAGEEGAPSHERRGAQTAAADVSAQEYVEQANLLRVEIHQAMLAISGNSLMVLEESLWRQQVLCTSLKRLVQSLTGTQVNSPAMARIRASTLALYRVNTTYTDLVQQSRKQGEVLYGLCRSYRETSGLQPGNRIERFEGLEA